MQNKSYIVKASQAADLKQPTQVKEFKNVDDFPRFTESGFALIKMHKKTNAITVLKDKISTTGKYLIDTRLYENPNNGKCFQIRTQTN